MKCEKVRFEKMSEHQQQLQKTRICRIIQKSTFAPNVTVMQILCKKQSIWQTKLEIWCMFWTSMNVKLSLTQFAPCWCILGHCGRTVKAELSLQDVFLAEIFIPPDVGSSLLRCIINRKEKENLWSCFCVWCAAALRWQKWSPCWILPPRDALGGGTLCRTSWGLQRVWTPETSPWNWLSFPSKVTCSLQGPKGSLDLFTTDSY